LPKLVVVYDSKTGNTQRMAEAVADGARKVKEVEVTVRKIGEAFPITELEEADGIILGSPCNYANVTPEMRMFLDSLKKADLKDKVGAAFGSWGWSGEAVEIVIENMESFGMTVLGSVEANYKPSDEDLKKCSELGEAVADKIKT